MEEIVIHHKNLSQNDLFSIETTPTLTFILPTMGRDTLYESIQSLLHQTHKNWKCILVIDGQGMPSTVRDLIDDRFTLLNSDHYGSYSNVEKRNCAGEVRNEALRYLHKQKQNRLWVAFLDDDDILSDDYVECFHDELRRCPSVEAILFRMQFKNGMVLPSYSTRQLRKKQFGISFCFQMKEDELYFINDPFEDYIFLKCLEYKKYKIVISPYITYYVRFTSLPKDANIRNQKSISNMGTRIYMFG
jgi:glycosyltransferase involved in cell wall biosynthesis